MNIIQTLEDIGFEKVITELTVNDKFYNLFLGRNKKPIIHDYWLEKTIDDKKYEVFLSDMHQICIRIDGEMVFSEDGRKIENRFILLYIPGLIPNRDFDVEEFTYWYNNIYRGYKAYLRLDKLSTDYVGKYCKHIGINFDHKYYKQVYKHWKI